MKLMIDIDEKIYRAVIEDNDMEIVGDNTIELGRAIINGTPVSNEGDLISRSALKKEFQDRLSACEDWINHTACDISRAIATRDFCIEVIMTINNAPKVAESCKELHEVATDMRGDENEQ